MSPVLIPDSDDHQPAATQASPEPDSAARPATTQAPDPAQETVPITKPAASEKMNTAPGTAAMQVLTPVLEAAHKTKTTPAPLGRTPTPLAAAPIDLPSMVLHTEAPIQRRVTFRADEIIPRRPRAGSNQRPLRSEATYLRTYNEDNLDLFTMAETRLIQQTPARPRTRSQVNRKRGRNPHSPPKDNTVRKRKAPHGDHFPGFALTVQAVHSDGIMCPSNYKQALNGPQRKAWIASMEDELNSLRENNVFGPAVEKLPSGRKGISSKWIFVIKRDENGKLLRFKSRLVARGFTQRAGIDFDKTFAPVMKQSLLRTVLAEACHNDWDIEQIDIKTAFLYGELDETIFLKLPDGTLHHLQRALYGLKQAGRQWYARFHKSLEKFGLKRLFGDPCCYHLNSKTETLIVMIHVDDAIITGSKPETISALKKSLREEYRMTDLGAIKHCLGWEITRDRTKRILTISQRQYITELLITYNIPDEKVKSCPSSMITLHPLAKDQPKLDRPY